MSPPAGWRANGERVTEVAPANAYAFIERVVAGTFDSGVHESA
jgi:hypothetical protein